MLQRLRSTMNVLIGLLVPNNKLTMDGVHGTTKKMATTGPKTLGITAAAVS